MSNNGDDGHNSASKIGRIQNTGKEVLAQW